jgi:hypothetical protein
MGEGISEMKIFVNHKSGGVTIIDDACDHDLADVVRAMTLHHRRWLKRLRPNIVTVTTGAGQYVFLVSDISSASCIIQ